MTIAAMRNERAQALNAAKALTDKAKAENRDLTDAEATSVEGYLAKAKELQTRIEAAERRAAMIAEVDQAVGNLPQANAPPRTVAGGAQPGAQAATVRDRAEDDPRRGFRSPRDFFGAVMRAGMNGPRGLDPRLSPLAIRGAGAGADLATAGGDEQGDFSDPYGGFLIPQGFLPTLLQVNPEQDPTAGRTMAIPMASSIVKIPARTDKDHTQSVSGGLRFYRRQETGDATASRQQYEQIELKANSLMGLAYLTEELLSDSPMSVAALIEAGFRDEYAATIFNEKLFGTGNGQYLGIMKSPCLVTVAKESGQANTTIVYQNVLKMRAQCWGYSQAIWIANHDTFPQLAQMQLAVGTGGSAVYQPSAVIDRPDTLLGRPIFYSEFASTLGTTGDIILGNWSQYLEGQRQGLESAESIHVRFVQNERAFRIGARNDGAPWWRTALTPKKSSSALSPFVVLASRP